MSELPALLYILVEGAIALGCWRVAQRVDLTPVEGFAAWIALQLGALALAPVSPGQPLVLAVLGLSAWFAWKPPASPATDFLPKSGPALLALMPLLAVFLRPVREPDSLFNLHFVFGWLDEGRSVLDFAFHYVPFWEYGYTPGLILASNDAFLWVPSLKAIALLGALLWLISGEFGLQGRLRVSGLAAAMLFVHLWHGPSGLATIKNDMIAAAGQAALALALLRLGRGRFGLFEQGLTVAGAIFVSTKFSGPVLLVLVLPVLLWQMRANSQRQWAWLIGGAMLWLATVGPAYIRNTWMYGNPVYPFQLNLGPLRLPGLGDLSNTSILYNLNNPEVWRLFFLPDGGLSALGLLFPLALAVLPFALWRARRGYALFTLACLFVYVRSVFSASGQPGDLQFVRNDLNSFRYVEGAWMAGELFLLSLLSKWPRVALAAAAINGLSRLWILFERARPEAAPDWTLFLPGILLACAAALLAWRWPRRAGWALLLLLPAGALMVESRRSSWLPQWAELYRPVFADTTRDLFLIVDDRYSEQACAHLPFKGRRLVRTVRTGPLSALHGEQYVVWIRRAGQDEPVVAGYRVKVRSQAGALYERI